MQPIFYIAQNVKDTSNLSIALTSFLFPENSIYSEGYVAIGPSVFLNDEKLSLQFGFLYDPRSYYIYERGSSHYSYNKVKAFHAFLPFSVHYKFASWNKFDFIASASLIFEWRPETTDVQFHINIMGGMGVKYNFSNKFNFKLTPNAQYTSETFIPGLLIDFAYSFIIIRNKMD